MELAESEKITRLNFLCDYMELYTDEKFGARYPPHTVREAINLYLRNQNAYKAARNLLILPHSKTKIILKN